MAKKDTMKALRNRDISDETAALLLSKYNTLSAISAAGEAELVELGLAEEEAKSVIIKIGKRPSTSSSKAKKVVEEDVPVQPMEEVTNFYQYSDGELRLKALSQELGIELPMKIYVDIAARIKNADLDDVLGLYASGLHLTDIGAYDEPHVCDVRLHGGYVQQGRHLDV